MHMKFGEFGYYPGVRFSKVLKVTHKATKNAFLDISKCTKISGRKKSRYFHFFKRCKKGFVILKNHFHTSKYDPGYRA